MRVRYLVNPSTVYTFTAAYRAAITSETVAVWVEWYDDTDTFISASVGTAFSDSDTAWNAISPLQQATSPSNATQAYILHVIEDATGGIAIPAEPTVTPTGTTGSTLWHYGITAYNAQGETPLSAVQTTSTGNATLSGTNYNALSWSADTDASGYNVYRSPAATCDNILTDFVNCADLVTDFATCADLITYIPELFYIGTTTGTSLDDTGLSETSQTPPTVNITGETHYVDEVGLFEGVATTWIDAQGGYLQVLRSDGNYVLGASPLFPAPALPTSAAVQMAITALQTALAAVVALVDALDPETATPAQIAAVQAAIAVAVADADALSLFGTPIVDYTAPYGLPVSYTAILVAGDLTSPPSAPSVPVVMGQAPDTTALYNRIGWAKYKDTTGVLLRWLAGMGEMVQAIDSLCMAQNDDGTIAPGWSQVLDINRCPTAALPWLGQFVGVSVDPSQRDDQQRYAIEQEHGFARGTPAGDPRRGRQVPAARLLGLDPRTRHVAVPPDRRHSLGGCSRHRDVPVALSPGADL